MPDQTEIRIACTQGLAPGVVPLLSLLLTVACGPDSAGLSTAGGGGETDGEIGDSSTGLEPAEPDPRVRILYSTKNGIEIREAADGVVEPAQLILPGTWLNGPDGRSADGRTRVVGDWAETPVRPHAVDCPGEYQCRISELDNRWVASSETPGPGGLEYFAFDPSPDGPELEGPLYEHPSAFGYGGFADRYLVAVEDIPGARRIVRIAVDGETEPEVVFEIGEQEGLDTRYALSRDQRYFWLRSAEPSLGGWREEWIMADMSADTPVRVSLPLREGATGHGAWEPIVHPGGLGFLVVQGAGAGDGDLVWLPLRSDGSFGAPIQVSTGESAGGVANNSAIPPHVTFSADGGWTAYEARPSTDEPAETYLVHWGNGLPGPPIRLDHQATHAQFSEEGAEVFFLGGPEGERFVGRAALRDGLIEESEAFMVGADVSWFQLSVDASAVAMTNRDRDQLWVVDLAGATPQTRGLPECGTVDVSFSLSEDGSLVACSSGEAVQVGRRHLLVGVRSEEVVELDATHVPTFVTPNP